MPALSQPINATPSLLLVRQGTERLRATRAREQPAARPENVQACGRSISVSLPFEAQRRAKALPIRAAGGAQTPPRPPSIQSAWTELVECGRRAVRGGACLTVMTSAGARDAPVSDIVVEQAYFSVVLRADGIVWLRRTTEVYSSVA